MKIKKNGKVVNLTESDLKRIVKRTLSEQEEEGLTPPEKHAEGTLERRALNNNYFMEYLERLGGFQRDSDNSGTFTGPDGRRWVVSKEWVWNEQGKNDEPKWVDPHNRGQMGEEFEYFFKHRKES